MQVNDTSPSPLILGLRINHFCSHFLPILCVESENLIHANFVINTYAYERIIIITLKYDKSTLQKWVVNLIVWLKPSNMTGPKTRQSESKMMFQSQMMNNYGILSPS